jgi:drug/metabolite transporter (DMT)-like permease
MAFGIFLALLSSASFGFNGATVRRAVSSGAASQGLYITIFAGLPMFILASAVSGQLFDAGEVAGHEYGYLMAGGILHILAGRYSNYRAVGAIGANRSAPIVGTSGLFAIVIAVLFLSETVTVLMGAGIALMMVGPALVAPRRRARPVVVADASPDASVGEGAPARQATRGTAAANPKMLEGYIWGGLAAMFWGTGPVLMRAGLEHNGLGIWGGTVAYGAAAVLLVFSLAIPGQLAGAVTLDGSARRWFLLSAVNSFVANLFRFWSLALAPVTLVIPLMRTAAIFRLIFNFFINRSLESFDPRVLAGIGISVAGATLLVIKV